MNEAELIEKCRDEFEVLAQKAYKSGLNYWQILGVMLQLGQELMELAQHLYIEAEAEYRLKSVK